MTLIEQVQEAAATLAGSLDTQRQALLEVLCREAVSSLTARLKAGLTPQDCLEDFVAAASLTALAALGPAAADGVVREFQAGDLSVKTAAGEDGVLYAGLDQRARRLMAPYLADGFRFLGV